jgi:membrane associated rhomboid family serine protease
MFLPIKADFPLPRFPVLTVIVCVLCLGVHLKQQYDWTEYGAAVDRFCAAERSNLERMIFDRVAQVTGAYNCADVMYTITNDPVRDVNEVIADLARDVRPLTGLSPEDSRKFVQQKLEEEARRFAARVPSDPDSGLAYNTASWNPLTMVTSSFAHGDWLHIGFNLVFFFAFAATVEFLVGPAWFLGFILVDSWFIGVTGSLFASLDGEHYWTLGLSGIVMGMMGLFAYLLPHAKIRCYYFFIIIFGSVAIPGWILVAWYLGSDVLTLLTEDNYGMVNVMAHVMGGLGGYLFGVLFLSDVRRKAVALQADLDWRERERRLR